MAFLIPTNSVEIARFANGLFGLQLGFATTNGIISDVASSGLNGAFNNYYQLTYANSTTANVATSILTNIGIVAGSNGLTAAQVANAQAYVVGQLNAATLANRGAAVKSILDMFATISSDPVNGPIYGAASAAWNNQISKAVQYAGAINPDITVAAAALLPAAPNNIALTTGTDNVTGSPSAANNISGLFNGTTATFGAGDTINPSGTSNSITLSDLGASTGTFNPTTIAALTVNNVQSATITSAGTLTVNTASTAAGNQGWGGLTNLTVSDSGGGGNTSVTSALTTNTTLIESAAAATTTTVNGGLNVNATVSGITGTGGALTVGGTTSATQPAGTVSLTANVAAQAAATTVGAVTINGGTVVTSTQAITAPTNTITTNSSTAPFVGTAGATTINGTASTTSVTVTNPTPVAATSTIQFQPIVSSTTQPSETINIATAAGATTYVVQVSNVANAGGFVQSNGSDTTTYAAFTAAQVATVAAGGTVRGLTLTNSGATSYVLSAPTTGGAVTATATTTLAPVNISSTASAGATSQLSPTITAATGGLYAAPVTINDVNGLSTTAAGTIATVTIGGLSNNLTAGNTAGSATIVDNALTTLNINNALLSASTVTITNNLSAPSSTAGLTLNLNNTPGNVTLADTNNELRSLTITVAGGGTTTTTVNALTLPTTTATGGALNLTSLSVSSAAASSLNLSSLTAYTKLSSMSISGAVSLIGASVSTANTALTTISDSSSGVVFMTIAPTVQSFTSTGTGNVYLSVSATATKAETAGNANVENAIIWAPASGTTTVPSTLVGTGGSYTNFNNFATGTNAASGTYNIATLQPAGSTFTALNIQGGNNITFSNVNPGTSLTIDTTAGSDGYITTGTTGASNSLTLNLGIGSTSVRVSSGALAATTTGFTTTALTLSDANTTQGVANGLGTLTINGNASRGGQTHTITTLTDSSLSTLNISGTAGVTIPTISSDVATSLTVNNTSTSSATSTIGGTSFTDNSLTSLTFTGTGPTSLSLSDTSATLTITNTATGAITIPTLAGGAGLSTMTTAGTGAMTITSLTSSNASFVLTQNDTAAVSATTITDASLTNLTVGGTGAFNVGNLTITPASLSITDTDSGAVNLSTNSALVAAAATAPTYINGGTGTFTVVEADTHTGATNISLINGVAYSLNDGNSGAAGTQQITISGTSDNSNVGIFLGNIALTATAQTSASTTLAFASSPVTAGVTAGMLVTGTNIPAGDYVTAVSSTGVTLAVAPLTPATASSYSFGGNNAAAASITLGNGNDTVILPASAANESVTLGTATGTGNNTVRTTGTDTGTLAITLGNGNNTVVLGGADAGANANTITVGTGTNSITFFAQHTNSASNVTFTAANASSSTAFTTITNYGANLANTTANGAVAAGGTTVTLTSATGVGIGMIIRDTTAAGLIPANTTITAINGSVATLSSAITGAGVANGDTLSIGNGGVNTDSITFKNAALNTNVFNEGVVSSISSGISGASTTQGYSTFSVSTTQYLYEYTGAASTSELVALVGTGHTFTPNANLLTVAVLT